MVRHIDGVIFDLDGVLVDTARFHFQAWQRLAESWNITFTQKDNERLKGVSRRASLEILLSLGDVKLSENEILEAMDRKNRWYVELIGQMNSEGLLPGALDLLLELKRAGIKTALGSASKNAPLILERTGLAEHLDAVVDGNRTSRAKPDPEVFLLAAKDLNLSPLNCIVFEDAAAGIEAAINAGMRTVGVGNPAQLKAANLVIPSLEEIEWKTLRLQLET